MKQHPETFKSEKRNLIYGFLIFGCILFFIRLSCFSPWNPDESFWSDEIGTVLIAEKPVSDLLGFVLVNDVNPPFFYLLLHFWIKIGASDGFLRLLPFVFGMGLLPAAFIFARQIGNRRVAGYGVMLFAASPVIGYYSTELRYPTLLAFLSICSSGFFIKLIQSEGAKGRVGYLIFSALAFYTHYTFLFIFAGQGFFLLFTRSSIRSSFGRILKTQILTLLLVLPAGAMALFQMMRGNGWIKALGERRGIWENFRDSLHTLTFVHSPKGPSGIWGWLGGLYPVHSQWFWWMVLVVSLPLLILFVFGLSGQENRVEKRFLLFYFGSAFFFPLIADLFTPIFSPKLLVPAVVPFLIIVAFGCVRLAKKHRGMLVVTLVVIFAAMIGSCLQYKNQSRFHRDNWKQVAKIITEQALPKDVLFNFDFELDYYFQGDLPSVSLFSGSFRQMVQKGNFPSSIEMEKKAQKIFSTYDRLWVRENRYPQLTWLNDLQGKIFQQTIDITPKEMMALNIPVRLVATNPAMAKQAFKEFATSQIDFSKKEFDSRQLSGFWLMTEDGWAWTTNESAAYLKGGAKNAHVEVEIFANSDLFLKNQAEVELYLNGARVAGYEVDGSERFVLSGDITGGEEEEMVRVEIRCNKIILPDMKNEIDTCKKRTVLIRRIKVIL